MQSLTTLTASGPGISDNPLLLDISGFTTLANAYNCTSDTSSPVLTVNIQLYPNGPSGGICYLTSYADVCHYIAGGGAAVGC